MLLRLGRRRSPRPAAQPRSRRRSCRCAAAEPTARAAGLTSGVGTSSSSLWNLMGSAMVMTQYIRLTPDMQSKQGALWNRVGHTYRLAMGQLPAAEFHSCPEIKMKQQKDENPNDNLGTGLIRVGPVFGNMDKFVGLGVFVDTYPNEEKQQEVDFLENADICYFHVIYAISVLRTSIQCRECRKCTSLCIPTTWDAVFEGVPKSTSLLSSAFPSLLPQRVFPYISAMVNNGSLSYDHERDGRPTELGGCTAIVRNLHYDTFLVIRYVKRHLTIMMDIDGKHEWRDCIEVPGVRLPRGYYFGTSSITGDLSDNHDVISLKLFELTVERTPEEEKLHRDVFLPSVDNMKLPEMTAPLPPLSGLALFLIVFFSLVFSVFAIVIGIILYNKWQEQSRKRFY
ncbi:hypothetical protein HPG69_011295 [Diceros bicornis minor]|uniref:L-type lectin-like domain-containing protein n=1 Tax=Diceros bicornis minor TaxID=77932 RepID=A0A7J7FDQ9_DICBM|nr:hypothetical protein HPG69_011295 [Diceros bicornis minor]